MSEAEIVTLSVTERGRRLASRLEYRSLHGNAKQRVAELWGEVGALVLFLGVGAAVRIVAPLLGTKHDDPAVVCVDESGAFAISLVGGHHGRGIGANDLCRSVAGALGATPVITTASDATGLPAIDSLPGFHARGDLTHVTRLLIDGIPVSIVNEIDWPLPHTLAELPQAPSADGVGARITISDRLSTPEPCEVVLNPPSLVVGVGTESSCPPEALASLVSDALVTAGLAAESVVEVATIDRRSSHPAVVGIAALLDAGVRSFSPSQLAAIAVPHPSRRVAAAVGTPSVAEAASLAAAGPKAQLLVDKRRGPGCTVAIARRSQPRGKLSIVGLGPGSSSHRTPAATAAIRTCEVLVGFGPYVDICAELLSPHQVVHRFPIGEEHERAALALREARSGRSVALVCSGDPGVFAMAPLVFGLLGGDEDSDLRVEVVPGVTAANSAASLLGAPLGHDHAIISLSDLTTHWSTIAARIEAAASSGMAIAFYNPRSQRRTWQLPAALKIVAKHRSPETPVGLVTDATRRGQRVVFSTIGDLLGDEALVDGEVTMTTCVVVGAPETSTMGAWMVTPRGRPLR